MSVHPAASPDLTLGGRPWSTAQDLKDHVDNFST